MSSTDVSTGSSVPRARPDERAYPSSLRITADQVRYQLRTFTRSPVALFFSVGLPTFILIMMNTIFSGDSVTTQNGTYQISQFYTGGLAAFTAVSVCYTGLVNMIPERRDSGILKRWYTTPLPRWAFFAGWILSSLVIAFVGVVIQFAVALVLYGLELDVAKLPAMLVIFVVGVFTFSALGIAVAGLVPSVDAAPAVANATILPLAFISDVFIGGEMPSWLSTIAGLFPLKPFANAMQDVTSPLVSANDIWAENLSRFAVMVAWGVFGVILARVTFRWYPARASARRGRGRSRGANPDGVDGSS